MIAPRVQFHQEAIRRASRQLKKLGIEHAAFKRVSERAGPGDIRLGDGRWVSVKTCHTCPNKTRVSGKSYHYQKFRWNVHQHAKKDLRPDVWIFYAIRHPQPPLIFIAPRSVIAGVGPTISMPANPKRPYQGVLAPWRDRWDVCTGVTPGGAGE